MTFKSTCICFNVQTMSSIELETRKGQIGPGVRGYYAETTDWNQQPKETEVRTGREAFSGGDNW